MQTETKTSPARSWRLENPAPTPDDLKRFWIDDGLRNILPPGENPAGFDEVAFLAELHRLAGADSVVELGCGYGRLARTFSPSQYLGVDINPGAIEKARTVAPDYRFETISFGDALPAADLCLAYTVLLHVDDANIKDVVGRITASFEKVLVVEIMERRLRELPSQVPNYCRDRGEYERLFAAYSMQWEVRRPYEWYRDQELDLSYVLLDRC